jgi:hypothetical protein
MEKKVDINKLHALVGKMSLKFQEFEFLLDKFCSYLINEKEIKFGIIVINGKNISEKLDMLIPLFEEKFFKEGIYFETLKSIVSDAKSISKERNIYIHSHYIEWPNTYLLIKGKRRDQFYDSKVYKEEDLEKLIEKIEHLFSKLDDFFDSIL